MPRTSLAASGFIASNCLERVDTCLLSTSTASCHHSASYVESFFNNVIERMANDFSVRSYQDEDHSELVELWEVCFPDDPPWNNPVDVIRTKLTVQPELLFVCIAEGRVVGSALVGFDGFRGWVNKVATHPEYQRRGIASLLMKTAEEALTAIGCPKLNLQVRADNPANVAFYQSAGYEIEERISMGKRLQ